MKTKAKKPINKEIKNKLRGFFPEAKCCATSSTITLIR